MWLGLTIAWVPASAAQQYTVIPPGGQAQLPIGESNVLNPGSDDCTSHAGTFVTVVPSDALDVLTPLDGFTFTPGTSMAVRVRPEVSPGVIIGISWATAGGNCYSANGIVYIEVGQPTAPPGSGPSPCPALAGARLGGAPWRVVQAAPCTPPAEAECTTTDELLFESAGCSDPCSDGVSAEDLGARMSTYDQQAQKRIERLAEQQAAAARRGDLRKARSLLDLVAAEQATRSATLDEFQRLLAEKRAANGCGPSSADIEKYRQLLEARAVLMKERARMEQALGQLDAQANVFCTVSGAQLGITTGGLRPTGKPLPDTANAFGGASIGAIYGYFCGKAPAKIAEYLNARQQLDEVIRSLGMLDRQIKDLYRRIQSQARPSRVASSSSTAATGAAGGGPSGAANPLEKLVENRAGALAAMRLTRKSLAAGKLADARARARLAAARLSATPALCRRAAGYLDRRGLRRIGLSRKEILRGKEKLAAKPRNARLGAWARALDIGRGEAMRRVVVAILVPPEDVGGMTASALVCGETGRDRDTSLAAAYRRLAKILER